MKIKKAVIAAMTLIAAFLEFDCLQINSVYASDKQGTDGTEMNAYEAEELEIYLGKDFAGKKFKLETDAGIYPGAVSVGDDGVLRVEIGGSKSYKLSVMDDGEEKKLKDNKQAAKSLENDETVDDKTNSDKEKAPVDENAGNVNHDKKTNKNTNTNNDADNNTNNNINNNSDNNIKEVTQPPVTDEVTSVTDTEAKPEEVNVKWTKDETKKNGLMVLGIPLKHLIIFIVGMIIAIDGLIVINLIQKKRREEYEEEYDDDEYYDEEYDDDYEEEE